MKPPMSSCSGEGSCSQQPFLCPLSRVIAGTAVRIKRLSAPPEVTHRLREMGFYVSGSAALQPASAGAIDRLAGGLKARPEALRIEGHTDNQPIHNEHYQSNWESTLVASLFQPEVSKYEVAPWPERVFGGP